MKTEAKFDANGGDANGVAESLEVAKPFFIGRLKNVVTEGSKWWQVVEDSKYQKVVERVSRKR